jgi:hypothetical protein
VVQALKLVLFLSFFAVPLPGFAADSSTALTVTTLDARLYPRQDNESKFIATLEKGEKLQPLAHGVGNQPWYMVKTSTGIIGWVQATDVSGSTRLDEKFKDTISEIRPLGPHEIPTKEDILSQCLKRVGANFEETWEEHCKVHGFKGRCTVLPVAVADSLKRDHRSAREECLRLYAVSQDRKN